MKKVLITFLAAMVLGNSIAVTAGEVDVNTTAFMAETAQADNNKTALQIAKENAEKQLAESRALRNAAQADLQKPFSERSFGEQALIVVATPVVLAGYVVAMIVVAPVYIVKKITQIASSDYS